MKLIIHNGILAYQYYLDGRSQSTHDLIMSLAEKAGVEIIKQGNGAYNYGETPVDWKGNKI